MPKMSNKEALEFIAAKCSEIDKALASLNHEHASLKMLEQIEKMVDANSVVRVGAGFILTNSKKSNNSSSIYNVVIEYGVSGYRVYSKIFEGTLEDIKAEAKLSIDKFIDYIKAANEEDGDLRRFCPRFANGYPTFNGEEDFEINVTLMVEKRNGKAIDLNYHSPVFTDLRNSLRVS